MFYILDKEFNTMSVLDGYESFIWTDRYCAAGDFEIYTPISSDFLDFMIPDYYLWSSDTNHMMIIEDISIVTEVDTGNHVQVTGRSLEAILDRRIIQEKKSFTNADPLDVVYSLLSSEIENPSNTKRKISNFTHTATPEGLKERTKVNLELFGESLYETIVALLEPCGLGFSVVLNSEENGFIFSIYSGVDHSFSQDSNPWVIFSSEYENLVDTNYTEQHSAYKNAVTVKGEEDSETGVITKLVYDLSDANGLDRKELYVDANDIQKTDENINPIPESRYQELLLQRAKESLDAVKLVKTFEGGVETHESPFIFKEDYNLGDIVQIQTPTKVETSARITEVIQSFSDSGIDTVPTFSILD